MGANTDWVYGTDYVGDNCCNFDEDDLVDNIEAIPVICIRIIKSERKSKNLLTFWRGGHKIGIY